MCIKSYIYILITFQFGRVEWNAREQTLRVQSFNRYLTRVGTINEISRALHSFLQYTENGRCVPFFSSSSYSINGTPRSINAILLICCSPRKILRPRFVWSGYLLSFWPRRYSARDTRADICSRRYSNNFVSVQWRTRWTRQDHQRWQWMEIRSSKGYGDRVRRVRWSTDDHADSDRIVLSRLPMSNVSWR